MNAAIRRLSFLSILAIAAIVLFATPAGSDPPPLSSSDCVMVIDGVPGESTKIPGGIDLNSFAWGVHQVPSEDHPDRRRVQFNDLSISKQLDKASPLLLVASADRERIPSATLTARRGSAQEPYLTVTLTDVLVSSYQTSGSCDGGEKPAEQVSFTFARMDKVYRVQDADGGFVGQPVRRCWDLRSQRRCD